MIYTKMQFSERDRFLQEINNLRAEINRVRMDADMRRMEMEAREMQRTHGQQALGQSINPYLSNSQYANIKAQSLSELASVQSTSADLRRIQEELAMTMGIPFNSQDGAGPAPIKKIPELLNSLESLL